MFLDNLDSYTTYAGKVQQADISVPIVHAAIGNEDYIDVYNASEANGLKISSANVPQVLMPNPSYSEDYQPSDNYEGPTGFAAPTKKTPVKKGLRKANIDVVTKYPAPAGYSHTKKGYQDYIRDRARKKGYDDTAILIFQNLIRQESRYDPTVISPKGAIGIGQFMPDTAKGYKIDPYNPWESIDAMIDYVGGNYRTYDGNWSKALASYNAGPGAVKKYGGVPPYKETQNYVKIILAGTGVEPDFGKYDMYEYNIKDNPKLINKDTGLLDRNTLNNVVYLVNNSKGYVGKAQYIITDRPELLEDREEFRDFKNFRDMKAPDGKPLFRKGNVNGFKIVMKNEPRNGKLNPNAIPAIAQDMTKTQFTELPKTDNNQAQALLQTMGKRYNYQYIDYGDNKKFGLANLTFKEYEDYGLRPETIQNPIMQARVLNQEFQRANDLLGSERKAIYAIAGGTLVDEKGKVKSWSEIKEDKDAYMKNWYIKPTGTDQEISEINAMVEQYERTYARLRGV